MPFLILGNVNFQFGTKKLIQKSYIIVEALATSNQLELNDKHEFANDALDKNSEIVVVYVVALEATGMTVYLFQANQVRSAQLARLK